MSPVNAGIVILIGEIVDGSSTLISGALTDKFGFLGRFIQRKISWHIFGTIIALVTFSLMFTPPPYYQPGEWSQSQLMAYYLPWVIFWAYSFATIQVSHLALICDLSNLDRDRIWLNSIRNAFTVVSAICVHVSLMLLIDSTGEETNDVFSNRTTQGIGLTKNSKPQNFYDKPFLNLIEKKQKKLAGAIGSRLCTCQLV